MFIEGLNLHFTRSRFLTTCWKRTNKDKKAFKEPPGEEKKKKKQKEKGEKKNTLEEFFFLAK